MKTIVDSNFNLNYYMSLNDIEDIKKKPNFNIAYLKDLGYVVCKFNLEEYVGISLIHRHFDLFNKEKMVGDFYFDSLQWVSYPQEINESNLIPINWQFYNTKQSFTITPIDFLIKDVKFLEEIELVKNITSNTNFLNEIGLVLKKHNISDIFGICLLLNRLTPNIPEGMVLYEQNDDLIRTSTIKVVSTKNLLDKEAVTHWKFKKEICQDKITIIPKNKRWCEHL